MINQRAFAVLRALARGFFALFYPIRVRGAEHVPQDGPVILCANHESLTDPVAIVCALQRPVRFMAKKELFAILGLGPLLRALGAFPVDRGGGDLSAVRSALDILKEGNAFGIFPQGSRSWKGGGAFKSGVALIALRSKAPVVPVYVSGRVRLFRPLKLTFGQAVDLSEFAGPANSQVLQTATVRIEQAVYALKEKANC